MTDLDAAARPGAGSALASDGPARTPAAPDAAPVTDAGGTRTVRAMVFIRDRGIIVLWLLLIAVFAFWGQPYFFTLTNAALVANAAALTALFAAAVAFGILSGALDLSVPAAAALASVLAGQVLTHGGPVWLAVVVGLAGGSSVGFINGVLVQRGLNPLVVTIASLTAIGGLANLISNGLAIPGINQLGWMGTATYWGIPAPVLVVAVVYIAGWVFLTKTRAGARLQAVGGNVEAVRRVGISADRYRILGFVPRCVCRRRGWAGCHRDDLAGLARSRNWPAVHGDHRRRAVRHAAHRWPREPAPGARRRAHHRDRSPASLSSVACSPTGRRSSPVSCSSERSSSSAP